MTEALCNLLRNRLTPLDLIERLEGLARPYQTQAATGPDGELRTVRTPVPVRFTPADCERDERYLVPDAGTASLAFFEDHGGTSPTPPPVQGGRPGFRSQVRLVLWLNPACFAGPLRDVEVLGALERALSAATTAEPGFQGLALAFSYPPGDEALLSRYTALQQSPLLYAPYRLIGLDITASYRYNLTCADAPPARLQAPAPC